jgi:penicillin-binding protein 1A
VPKRADEVLAVGDLVRVEPWSESEGWRLSQLPAAQAVLVALDPRDGAIRALQGGFDFGRSHYNRAQQAKRQPGSGYKAFIYAAALDAGYTPASLINDAPIIFYNPYSPETRAWRPENYSRRFFGPTRLREGLVKSRNLVAVRLLRDLGIDRGRNFLKRFGFKPSSQPRNLTLALGSGSATPLQMARGYAVFANGGFLVEPYLIRSIDEDGKRIYNANPLTACHPCGLGVRSARRTLSPQTAFLMHSMLADVIQSGTASAARVLGRKDLAGKTGTTDDFRDAWFNGYHPSLVAVSWLGFDDSHSLGRGEAGAKAALPIWMDFMRNALNGVPEEVVESPIGIVRQTIDPLTGKRVSRDTPGARWEFFSRGVASAAEEPSLLKGMVTARDPDERVMPFAEDLF